MNTGIYIHVPFCASKCDYCSFYSIPCGSMEPSERRGLLDRYFSVLVREIEGSARNHGLHVDTVYFGGGTPSYAGPSLLRGVLDSLRGHFNLLPGAEISVECNPGDFSVSLAGELVDIGVNRITLGIQTFSGRLRSVIGRSAPQGSPGLLSELMSVRGVAHGIDLIAGIPGCGDDELHDELVPVTGMRPEHISAYMLSVEEGTPLARRLRPDSAAGEEQRRLFGMVMEILTGAGYRHYEISNFCLPGFESRHNLKYWTFRPYIGFGVRAHGFTGGRRFYNDQSLEEYLDGPASREDTRPPSAAMAEFIMTGLRLIDGFTAGDFEAALDAQVPASVKYGFGELSKRGMIDIAGDGRNERYRLTREGLFLADSVIYTAVESLL